MMRPQLSLIAAIAALALAGAARAETISLIWQATNSNLITVPASSAITADIVLRVTSTDLTAIGWNISWNDELAYLESTTVGGVVSGTDWHDTSSLNDVDSSPGTSPGHQRVYHFSAQPGFNMTPGAATVGTITFHVTANVTNNGTPSAAQSGSSGSPPISGDVSADFFNPTNGVGCFHSAGPNVCTIINGASVNVPEPGTLGLLALGLAGLGLAGLRSRR